MLDNAQTVLRQALAWRAAGQRCALVTVLRTFGASPRPPGAMAVVSAQGLIVGSVSGGCVEDTLVQEVVSGALWATPATGQDVVQQRVYGRDAEERARLRLPCGHALRLAIEADWQTGDVAAVLGALDQRRCVVKQLCYRTGTVSLHEPCGQPAFVDDEAGFRSLLGPALRLLLIGATEVSHYLAPIAQSLGYAVSVCDPRSEYTDSWQQAGVTFLAGMPDDVVQAFACDERSAVVTVTHDPKLDDLALMEALKTPAFYVGALGSRLTTARRKARLALFDLGPPQLDSLHGPVGLPIGSRSPAEIAVSIAAELVQVRRRLCDGVSAGGAAGGALPLGLVAAETVTGEAVRSACLS